MASSKPLDTAVKLRLLELENENLRLQLLLANETTATPKRIHKSKGKRKADTEEEESYPAAEDEAGPIDPTPIVSHRSKKRKVRSKHFLIKHPNTGASLKVGNFSHDLDRQNWNRVRAAISEGDAGGPNTDILVHILKEGLRRGFAYMDERLVPSKYLKKARADLRAELGDAEYERKVVLSEESSLTESFCGDFEEHSIHPESWDDQEVVHSYVTDLKACGPRLLQVIDDVVERWGAVKIYMSYACLMERQERAMEGGEVYQRPVVDEQTISSVDNDRALLPEVVRNESDAKDKVDILLARIESFIELKLEGHSGYSFKKSVRLTLHVSRMMGRQIGSKAAEAKTLPRVVAERHVVEMGSWVKIPHWLWGKKIQNPKPYHPSTDEACFAWSILRGLHPLAKDRVNRGNNFADIADKLGEIILPEGVNYPIPLDNITLMRIQEVNDFSFSIFELGNKTGAVVTKYISPFRGRKAYHFLLGMIKTTQNPHLVLIGEKEEGPLSKLFGAISNHKGYYCEGCLRGFRTQVTCSNHEVDCYQHEKQTAGLSKEQQMAYEALRIRMPTTDRQRYIKFYNWQHRLKAPFVIYADLEALVEPHGGESDPFQVHKPCGFSYKIVCQHPKEHGWRPGYDNKPLSEIRNFIGKSTIHKFFDSLNKDANAIEAIICADPIPMEPLTEEEEKEHWAAKNCFICEKPFNDCGYNRVHDHDHFTGEYRGPAHDYCNLLFTYHKQGNMGDKGWNYKIPIVFHNLQGYDGFHIMRGLKGYKPLYEADITVIARSLDRFTSFTISDLRFVDSLQFLKGSLDELVSNRAKGTFEEKKKGFPLTYQHFIAMNPRVHPWDEEEVFDMVLKKGVYPYDYMKEKHSLDRDSLPAMEKFWSILRNEGIEEEDYQRAQKMWDLMGCKTMADYTRAYCDLDVLLLADLYESLRNKCINFREGYGLDPVHYVSAPSLSWDAMLLMNHKKDIRIENMTDKDMLLMVKSGIRGGMCQVMNPPMQFFPDDTENHIWYGDVNALYSHTMDFGPMPMGDFYWEYNPALSNDEDHIMAPAYDFDKMMERVRGLDLNGDRGFILEVDIRPPSDPDEQDTLNDYPLLPVNKLCEDVSRFTKNEFAKEGFDWKPPTNNKLVLDLMPRTNYVIHYWNLRQAMEKGYVVTKIHRCFSFKQSRWLSDYVQYNIKGRAEAKKNGDQAAVDLFKLLNNSIYGKTVEDVMRRKEVKVFFGKGFKKGKKKAIEYASESTYRRGKIIWSSMDADDKGMMVMEVLRKHIVVDRPMVVGFTVLELRQERFLELYHLTYISWFHSCSKWWMFNVHYNHVQRYWSDNVRLLYTDTDSLVYHFVTKEGDPSFKEQMYRFNESYKIIHDSDLGKLKDEHGGKKVLGFCALRPKMYAFKYPEDTPDKVRMEYYLNSQMYMRAL